MGEGAMAVLKHSAVCRQGATPHERVLPRPSPIMTQDCGAWRNPHGESKAGLEQHASHRRSLPVYVDRKEPER
jgi:hypothetical protein